MNNIWDELVTYEKLIWKIVWIWHKKNYSTTEPNELYNELIVLYASLKKRYFSQDRLSFSRIFWKSAMNSFYDLYVRKKQVIINIDDVVVYSDHDVFMDIYHSFLLEEISSLLLTPASRHILNVLLHQKEILEGYSKLRRSEIKRKREINKEDLRYYFCQIKGWKWRDLRSAIHELENAVLLVLA